MSSLAQRPAVPGLYEYDDRQRPRLIASKCANCGNRAFPARSMCGECLGTNIETVRYGPVGTLYAYTVVHETFGKGSLPPPYAVAKVQFDDGFLLQGLLDPSVTGWRVGQTVETTEIELERDGDTRLMTYAFRPQEGDDA